MKCMLGQGCLHCLRSLEKGDAPVDQDQSPAYLFFSSLFFEIDNKSFLSLGILPECSIVLKFLTYLFLVHTRVPVPASCFSLCTTRQWLVDRSISPPSNQVGSMLS